jgi:N-methylhydantoinase A
VSAAWHVGVDIGGTFTDVVAVDAVNGRLHYLKVPSSRDDPASGVIEGLNALYAEAELAPGDVRLLLHGTTLATNAIIERRLARTGLVTTRGFADVLEIGRHWRTDLYDPFIDQPEPLVPRRLRLEVDERLSADGTELRPLRSEDGSRIVEELASHDLEAVAVVFLHSYRDPRHEEEMTELLRASGTAFVCGSAELSREVREYERTSTTVLNAALMPLVDEYLSRLERDLARSSTEAALFVTQSNGGALTPRAARARPVSLALSGPVGGVVACVEIGRRIGVENLIGFDMGGTSTDVSIISSLEPRFATELLVGEVPVRLPSVQVHSIGAGGGSIASVDLGGALSVGPASAGSDPGPACYGRGGTSPTVTDCQLVLGRLTEEFRLAGRLGIQPALASEAIEREISSKLEMTVEDAAAGVIEIANAAMERAIRVALRDRGDDPRDFALVAFGGAGPLHVAELARRLAIAKVIVPSHPGTLSALGFLAADVRLDFAASEIIRNDDPGLETALTSTFDALESRAREELHADRRNGTPGIRFERACDIRYLGQAYEVTVPMTNSQADGSGLSAVFQRFHELHERAYAFSSLEDPCEIVTFRLSAVVPLEKPRLDRFESTGAGVPFGIRAVFMPGDGLVEAPVYDRDHLPTGTRVDGPAVIHQIDATTLLPGFAAAEVDAEGNLVVTIEEQDA